MADRTPPPGGSFPEEPPTSWPAALPPSAALPPASSEPPPLPMWRAWPIMVLALAFAVVVTYGLGVALAHENRKRVIVVDQPPTTGPTTTTGPTIFRPTVDMAMPDLIAFVERTRGHNFVKVPTAVSLAPDPYRTVVKRWVDRRSTVIDNLAQRQITLGVAVASVAHDSLDPRLVDGLPVAVDGRRNRLAVRTVDGTTSPFVRSEMVRQLTRILDAQTFRKPAPNVDALGTEANFGARAVSEASAAWVASQYRNTFAAADQASYTKDSSLEAAAERTGPEAEIAQFDVLPQRLGRTIVTTAASQGMSALDALFRHPPTTSAQLLTGHVVNSQSISAAPGTGPVIDSGGFGAADLFLSTHITDETALERLVTDWGGGKYTLAKGTHGQACTTLRLVGNTPSQTQEIHAILATWQAAAGGPAPTFVTDPRAETTDHQVAEVTRCA